MSKNVKYIILGIVLVGMVALLFFVNNTPGSKKKIPIKEKKVKQEKEVVYKKLINPNGTFLLYKLLKGYEFCASLEKIQTTYKKDLSKILPKKSENDYPNTYISITEDFNLDGEDENWLKEFVYEGNQAFIAADKIGQGFRDLIEKSSYYSYYDTTVFLNFYHPDFKQSENIKINNGDLNSHAFSKFKNWTYYKNADLLDNVIRISYTETDNFPVVVKVKYGEGNFIISTIPSAFSNINLLKEEGKTYSEIIFSHLNRGNIYWHHDYGKYSPYRGITQPTEASPFENDEYEYPKTSPLQYILKVPALFSALILLIIGLIIYMLFQSKRRQRIIPAIETNENSSLEFVETVSKLYFQQKRHDKLIKHQEQYFLSYIKHHYYISSPVISDEFIQKISLKSGIDADKIKKIFRSLEQGKKNRYISDTALIDLYNQLEYFYKKSN